MATLSDTHTRETPLTIKRMDERRLLMALSDEGEYMHGISFVSHFFGDKENLGFTLFHLLPPPSSKMHGYRAIHAEGKMEESIYAMHETRGREALALASSRLRQSGFTKEQIDKKNEPVTVSQVWDIMEEARRGEYDAIVLGNRGRSWLDRFLEGGTPITDEMLQRSCYVPIWLCAHPLPTSKNVLLCLDGSESAYRMVDHVGSMLGPSTMHKVTMLRVKRDNPAGPRDPMQIFDRAGKMLAAAGIPNTKIDTKVAYNNDVADAILSEAEAGDFAVIAAGRSGSGTGLLRKIFMGSVTEKVLKKLNNRALWVRC